MNRAHRRLAIKPRQSRQPADHQATRGGSLADCMARAEPARYSRDARTRRRCAVARAPPKKTRDWILFTDEQPTVPAYAGYTPAETKRALKRKEEPSYQGTFTGARRYVLHTFAKSQSTLRKKRVAQYMLGAECPVCRGKRRQRAVTTADSRRFATRPPDGGFADAPYFLRAMRLGFAVSRISLQMSLTCSTSATSSASCAACVGPMIGVASVSNLKRSSSSDIEFWIDPFG